MDFCLPTTCVCGTPALTPVLCWAVITQEFAKLTKAGLAELAFICPTPTAVFFRQAEEGEVRLLRCAYYIVQDHVYYVWLTVT
jgi:hypothetical protein